MPCRTDFIYDGDGNRLLKVENMLNQFDGGQALQLTTLYIGGIYERQFNTTANPIGQTVSGAIPDGVDPIMACQGGGDTPTDFGFTGQRNESGFGLYDYNARMYSPRLGRFISPDSIVPDPFSGGGLNRYRYARNSPFMFKDSSGHIAICFQGGFTNREDETSVGEVSFLKMCTNALINGGYSENHGDILTVNNGVNSIQYAYDAIVNAKRDNPEEPVLIMGYSWGGAAALDLATVLNNNSGNEPVAVNLLFLVDPEPDFRGTASWASPAVRKVTELIDQYVGTEYSGRFGYANSRRSPTSVSENVRSAINLFAADQPLTSFEWGSQNGLNEVEGALNIGLANTDHTTIVYPTDSTLNTNTQGIMTTYVFAALFGFPFQ